MGLIQICLLIGLELLVFLECVNVIVVRICSKSPIDLKHPFGTAGVNAVNIIESGYCPVSKALLSTFLTELMLEVSP